MNENQQAENISTDNTQNTLENLKKILLVWHWTANWMVRFTVIFGLSTIISSVLVSVYTSTGIITDKGIKVLACISTASLTLLTAFNVVNKGNNARQAWRILNAAIYKYETGEIEIKDLIYAYEIGEKILGNVEFSYGAASRSENGNGSAPPSGPENPNKNVLPKAENLGNTAHPQTENTNDAEISKPEDEKGDKDKRDEC